MQEQAPAPPQPPKIPPASVVGGPAPKIPPSTASSGESALAADPAATASAVYLKEPASAGEGVDAAPRSRKATRSASLSPFKKRRNQRNHEGPPIHSISGFLDKKTSGGLTPSRWKSGYYFETKAHYFVYSKKKGADAMGGVDLSGDETTIELIEDSLFFYLKVVGLSSDEHDEAAGETRTLRTMCLRTPQGVFTIGTMHCSIHDWYDALTKTRAALQENPELVLLPETENEEEAVGDLEAAEEAANKEKQPTISDIRVKRNKNRETFTVEVGPGKLGIALTLDPGTCMAVVQNDAAPEGQVDIGMPGCVKAGGRIEAMNGKNFGCLTSFDQDGDGQLDASELVSALETSDLRESWIARVGVDVASHQTNEEMADAIIAVFGAKRDGKLDGDETFAFFQMMLEAHLAQIQASPRPMTLTFSRPKPAEEEEETAEEAAGETANKEKESSAANADVVAGIDDVGADAATDGGVAAADAADATAKKATAEEAAALTQRPKKAQSASEVAAHGGEGEEEEEEEESGGRRGRCIRRACKEGGRDCCRRRCCTRGCSKEGEGRGHCSQARRCCTSTGTKCDGGEAGSSCEEEEEEEESQGSGGRER